MTRLLLLDVDGVTSPYKPVPDGHVAKLGGFRLPYRPAVIAAVRELVVARVRVMWLTTWEADILPDLATALELPQLEVPERVGVTADAPPASWRGWKTRTALRIVREIRPDRWAWADDHLHPATMRRVRQDHPEALLVAPDGDAGLTDDHLAAITRWLAEAFNEGTSSRPSTLERLGRDHGRETGRRGHHRPTAGQYGSAC